MIQTNKNYVKIKFAIFFGYDGKEYHGSQSQKDPNIKTVEKSLFEGLKESQLISEINIGELMQAGWGRGARTDKGVHALCNGVNLKLAISEDYLIIKSPQQELNNTDALIEDIVHVTKEGDMFNHPIPVCYNNEDMCVEDEQQIKDTLRQEILKKRKIRNQLKASHRKMLVSACERRDCINADKIINTLNSNLPDDIRVVSIKQVSLKFDIRTHCKYRVYDYLMPLFVFQKYDALVSGEVISEEQEKAIFEKVTACAMKFKGTHNYHNYTRKLKAKDPRAMRYILDMKTEVITNAENNMKFVHFTLFGQSFVYHQIRKMMGMICMMVQQDQSESFIETSFFHNALLVWLAPAHGLFLNRMHFDSYNLKEEIPELIIFDEKEEDRIRNMRKLIEKSIMKEDEVNRVYREWMKDVKEGREIVEEIELISDDES